MEVLLLCIEENTLFGDFSIDFVCVSFRVFVAQIVAMVKN